jgi:hypothetical protein
MNVTSDTRTDYRTMTHVFIPRGNDLRGQREWSVAYVDDIEGYGTKFFNGKVYPHRVDPDDYPETELRKFLERLYKIPEEDRDPAAFPLNGSSESSDSSLSLFGSIQNLASYVSSYFMTASPESSSSNLPPVRRESSAPSSQPSKLWPPTVAGAGVLPYAFDQHGEAWVLLGKETNSSTWCDFGGSRDPNEMIIRTAARECCEETRGIFGKKTEDVLPRISDLYSVGKYYGMYLMQVTDMNSITNKAFLNTVALHSTQMEKTQIAWVRAKDIIRSVNNHQGLPIDPVQIIINGKNELLRAPFANLVKKTLKATRPTQLNPSFPPDRDTLLNTLRVTLN